MNGFKLAEAFPPAGVHVGSSIEKVWHRLSGLVEDLHQVGGHAMVHARVVEAGCTTFAADAAGEPNALHVLADRRRHIVVDDVAHAAEVQVAGYHGRGDQHVLPAVAEVADGLLSLVMGPIAVDRNRREPVNVTLHLDEDERATRVILTQNLLQHGALPQLLDLVNNLLDVGGCAAYYTNEHADVVVQELRRQLLDGAREAGGKHERLARLVRRHMFHTQQLVDRRSEAHVEYAVHIVQHEQTLLVAHAGSAADQAHPERRSADKLTCHAVDLVRDILHRSNNQDVRVGCGFVFQDVQRKQAVDQGQHEGSLLARTSLGAHQ
uniref:Uncharacterized protein n=1 Tax=Anopheles atroparvus TaxID=41427 RepID=A0A182J374_ANOAO